MCPVPLLVLILTTFLRAALNVGTETAPGAQVDLVSHRSDLSERLALTQTEAFGFLMSLCQFHLRSNICSALASERTKELFTQRAGV